MKSFVRVRENNEVDRLAADAADPAVGLPWIVQAVKRMSNERNDAAEYWIAGDFLSALKK